MKKAILLLVTCIIIFDFCAASGPAVAGVKKILYVDSYHEEYMWSADITSGIQSVLKNRPDIELKIFRMDTKRNQAEEYNKQAARTAKDLINSWKPDAVIVSDDNAAQYLIVPYLKDGPIPVVFCGLNWDASIYGLPAANVTGMVEVALYQQTIDLLRKYARGGRIGYLASDTLSERKELDNIVSRFHPELEVRFAKTFAELKQAFIDLQKVSDMVLIQECRSVQNFDHREMVTFVKGNTTVPTGAMQKYLSDYALLTLAKSGEEQGKYAAQTALDILAGRSPAQIPVVANKEASIYLNMFLATNLGIKFPVELIENAHLISGERKKLFFVNSYHQGNQWSDEVEKGLLKALKITTKPDGTFDTSQSEVEFRLFRMDAKRNMGEEYNKQAALAARTAIEEWKPDILVTSDDNAAKYLVASYYKGADLPVVFSGVNWDAAVYGFPAVNITGIIEADPISETIALLRQFARGDRIGFIGGEDLSNRKSIEAFKKIKGINFADGKLVSTFAEWQKEYLRLQDSVDMLLWQGPVSIKGWNEETALAYIHANTRIPTGAMSENNEQYALLGRVKFGEEHGWRAGQAALRILSGTLPSEIPISINTESRLYLNMPLAKQMGIKFPMELLQEATLKEYLPKQEGNK